MGHKKSIWGRLEKTLERLGPDEASGRLGDFTTRPRVILLSAVSVGVGVLSAFVALALLRLIGFFTNLAYYGRLGSSFVSPAGNHLGVYAVLVPVVGAFFIGLMARYGTERIRGHGIPEAIEAILINGSKVEPRVAFWKPLSSALSIGTGGPFGAEGPIIMTGGAFGSLVAQFLHLSSAERRTLLVAGAAGGMSATFAAPISATLLAVELLLFEWKPRSLIPVALASATAGAARRYIMGTGPLFPVPHHPVFIGPTGLLGCVMVGLLAGLLSALLTSMVYAAEDAFSKLPIHWMWWPMLGGLAVGLGGLVFPQALGVGYDTIGALLQGEVSTRIIVGILVVKSVIWAVSLGSGTSGGVLAPLLMMGGALGGLASGFLPNEGVGFWPLISMGAILGGTMRSPFTGIIFAFELTHDENVLLPLLVAVVIAHGLTVLVLRRSILTEKLSRRGYHLSREYAVDPLEIQFVREVMQTRIVALGPDVTLDELERLLASDQAKRRQGLYPVVVNGRLAGVATRDDLERFTQAMASYERDPTGDGPHLTQFMRPMPIVAYPDEPLRVVVYRMAGTGRTELPVVDRRQSHKLMGLVTLHDLLAARTRNLEEERHRERVLDLRLPSARRRRAS